MNRWLVIFAVLALVVAQVWAGASAGAPGVVGPVEACSCCCCQLLGPASPAEECGCCVQPTQPAPMPESGLPKTSRVEPGVPVRPALTVVLPEPRAPQVVTRRGAAPAIELASVAISLRAIRMLT